MGVLSLYGEQLSRTMTASEVQAREGLSDGHVKDEKPSSNSAQSHNGANESAQELEHVSVGDVQGGLHEPPAVHEHMNLRLFMSLVAMSFLWVGSQIPLYLYGSVLPDIYGEIGGSTNGRWVWMIIGYLIPNAALCPFVGALSDLFGRKYVAGVGQVLLVIGGLGAGLNELIALAGTSELVPVRKRAIYVGGVVFTILPFCPSPLWAQLITKASDWRYNGFLIGAWNVVGLILVLVCYKDPVKPSRPA